MKYKIAGTCILECEYKSPEKQSTLIEAKIFLTLDYNVDLDSMMDPNNKRYTKNGTKAITQAFIQGLIGNIHQAHQGNLWDSAEHLRFIISELEKGFILNPKIEYHTVEAKKMGHNL